MNARLYDPLIGRFLSPDPYIQDPGFSQSFNRYSYALNNPLKHTDKSGEYFVLDSWLIGLVSGGTDRANQMAKNDAMIWGGLFNYDKNKGFGGGVWEIVSRLTWQLPQTLIGFLGAQTWNTLRLSGGVNQVDYLHGATTIEIDHEPFGGVTIGSYIFGGSDLEADDHNPLFQHEFGHYLQSQDYGPLMLSIIGVPSLISARVNDYYGHNAFYTEQDANARALSYIYNLYGSDFYEVNENGKQTTVWNFDSNPVTGYDPNKPFLDDSNQRAITFALISFSQPLYLILTGDISLDKKVFSNDSNYCIPSFVL